MRHQASICSGEVYAWQRTIPLRCGCGICFNSSPFLRSWLSSARNDRFDSVLLEGLVRKLTRRKTTHEKNQRQGLCYERTPRCFARGFADQSEVERQS